MSEDTTSLTRTPLFARKGEAAPAPAVGYVGIDDLVGKLNRRRAQRPYDGGERRHSVNDDIVGDDAPGTDEDAPAPQPTPGAAEDAPAPQPRPPAAPATGGAGGMLASLIHRRGDPWSPASESLTSAPEAAPPPQAMAPQRPVSKPPAARQASEPPAAASPAPAQAKAAKPGRKRKRSRRQLTVRLPVEQFARFNALAKQSGYTYQDILATATSLYLEQTADEGKKKGQAKPAKAGRRRAKSKR